MKRVGLCIIMVLIAAISAGSIAFALPNLPSNQGTDRAGISPVIDGNELTAPPQFAADPPESQLTKIVFIRYAPGKGPDTDFARPFPKPTPKPKPPKETPTPEPTPAPGSDCYTFLAGQAPRWNWTEGYVVTDAGLAGVSAWATQKWDSLTGASIFGSGTTGSGYTWGVYDYVNSISYGDYTDPDVVAVTALWYLGKNMYEYDVMFDTDYFPPDGTGLMDLDTVALHEIGHAAGLGDLYDGTCSDQVMYGYIAEGESRTEFGAGDIAGINALYGP